jgi:hypothetical protein
MWRKSQICGIPIPRHTISDKSFLQDESCTAMLEQSLRFHIYQVLSDIGNECYYTAKFPEIVSFELIYKQNPYENPLLLDRIGFVQRLQAALLYIYNENHQPSVVINITIIDELGINPDEFSKRLKQAGYFCNYQTQESHDLFMSQR